MKLCGEAGHRSRDGQLCRFRIPDDATSCHHHAEDQTRAREILSSAVLAQKQMRLPESIDVGDLQSLETVQRGYASVVKIAATERHADLKRLDVIIRALNGANTALQIQAMKELNETLLRAQGKGPALFIMQQIQQAARQPIPAPLALATKDSA